MELYSFVKDLLFQHDCVIIPGFGGFVANYRSAAINYNLNTFSPPGKDISFNRSLTNNDGLLIAHISEIMAMSYVDARNWLNARVKEWKRKLEKGKKVILNDIGTFQMGKDKNLIFEPANTVNYLVNSYGLIDFQFAPLEEYTKVNVTGRKALKEKPEHIRSGKTLRRVLIAVPAVVILALLPLEMNWVNVRLDFSSLNPFGHKTKIEGVTPAKVPGEKKVTVAIPAKQATTQHAVKDDNISNARETGGNVLNERVDKPVEKADVKKAVMAAPQYFIITGSFKNKSNAYTLKNRLEQKGKHVVIMNGPNGFYRVAMGGFADKKLALGQLKEQRKYPQGKYYWLLKK